MTLEFTPRVFVPHIDTHERHASYHTQPCNGAIFRDFAGNRACRGCGFTWSAGGWREEQADRNARTKGKSRG